MCYLCKASEGAATALVEPRPPQHPLLPIHPLKLIPTHATHTTPQTLQGYEGDQLRLLVHSLCPSIFGHELVKAGLLLSLFGGGRKASSSQADMALRGDIHVLLVGDPGLGKSQMLQVCFPPTHSCSGLTSIEALSYLHDIDPRIPSCASPTGMLARYFTDHGFR